MSMFEDGSQATVRVTSGTLQSITINFNDGSTTALDVRTSSPASFRVSPGVTVEVRFQ